MTNPDKSESSFQKLIQWLSNPYIGAIGALASIIGIPLAIYLYIQSGEYQELTFYFSPTRAQIYRADQTSNLSIRHNDRVIKSDISAVQIAIWNDGNESIRGASIDHGGDIIEPVAVQTADNVAILETSIRSESALYVNLALDQTGVDDGKLRRK